MTTTPLSFKPPVPDLSGQGEVATILYSFPIGLGCFVDLGNFVDSTARGGEKFRNRVKQVGIKGPADVEFAIAYVFVGER
jgi:hypothetical protein